MLNTTCHLFPTHLQYVHATQPELRAQHAAAGADGGWLGGAWRSGRALRRVARSPWTVAAEAMGSEQGRSSSRDGLAVVAAAGAELTPQPPSWWRVAVGDAVEGRLARSAGGRTGVRSAAQQRPARGRMPMPPGESAAQVAPALARLEARVELLRAYAGTGLWARRRGAPTPRVNPASAVMQVGRGAVCTGVSGVSGACLTSFGRGGW
jgi:hypothetical protein